MRHIHRAVVLFAALALGCGGDPPPAPKQPSTDVDAAEQGRITRSKRKIDEADRAYEARNYDKARKLLREAGQVGVESHRYDIGQAMDRIDKRQAKLYANEAQEKLEAKQCVAAFKALIDPMTSLQSETFNRELRRLVQQPASKCVQESMDEATQAGKFAEARQLVNAEETKTVLGPAQKKIAAELDGLIAEVLKAQIDGDLKAKKWGDAVAKLDASVKKGEADEAQALLVLAGIREAMQPEVIALAQKGVGQRDAPATLGKVDALIKVGRWEILPPGSAELAKGRALPEELAKKREVLAIWVEGQRLGMKPQKKNEKRWAHGKLPLAPASKADGESKRDLAAASQVWVIGVTKDKALVAESEPTGALAAQLDKAVGWVPLARLALEPTEDWLPPDDQLVGARVWAPLRAPDPLLELGTVAEVKGTEVSVKRIADDKLIDVPKKALKSGRLAKGTKVTGVCKQKDDVGIVDELLGVGGMRPSVKLKCGDELKEEFLPTLRTKVELLPATKQKL
jgi:hypothetical protein